MTHACRFFFAPSDPPTMSSGNRQATAVPPPFDFYVVLDFEAAFDKPDGPDKIMEVIELPSVVVDARTFEIRSEFQRYVRPVINPKMHPLATEITGITQATVDAAPPFPAVFAEYRKWLIASALSATPSPATTAANADSYPANGSRSFCFVCCGDWDIKTMFPVQFRNCGGVESLVVNSGIANARNAKQHVGEVYNMTNQWINLKDVFNTVFPAAHVKGMTDMLKHLHLPLIGRHHSGIDDCRNIAAVLQALLRRGDRVDVTNTRACVQGALSNGGRFAAMRGGDSNKLPGRLPTFSGNLALPFAPSTLADRTPLPVSNGGAATKTQAAVPVAAAAGATAAATAAVPAAPAAPPRQGPVGSQVAPPEPRKRKSKSRVQ